LNIKKVSSEREGSIQREEEFPPDLSLEVIFDGNRIPLNIKLRKKILLHDLIDREGA
jgi:hypothetical protein